MGMAPTRIETLRSYFRFLDQSGENLERVMRSSLAISRLANQHRVSATLSNTWNFIYLGRISSDLAEIALGSTFFETNPNGSFKLSQDKKHYVSNGLLWIAGKVSTFSARVLFLVTSLHEAGLCRIRQIHMTRLYFSIATIWTVVATGAFFTTLQKALNHPAQKEHYMECSYRFLDLSSIIFDLFRPVSTSCGYASAALHLAAGISALVYECAWRRPV